MKTINLIGDVGYEITGDYIRRNVDFNSSEPLRVLVNSPGGYVSDAIEIYNLFKSYKGEVEFVILAYAASAMSYIIMSGAKITAFKNSVFMAHNVWSAAVGDSDELARAAQIAAGLTNVVADAYIPRLGTDKADILARMKNEIWLIGWEQMTEAGLIDNVIESVDGLGVPADIEKTIKSELALAGDLKNIVQMKLAQSQRRMKQDEQSSLERAAAYLPTESQRDNTPAEINPHMEEGMNLQDFLKSNPEAKAEYDNILQTAEAKGSEKTNEAIAALAADRERLAKILELEGVELSETAAKAIAGEMSVESYMEEELKRQKGLRAEGKDKNPFGRLVAKQTPKEQDPKGAALAADNLVDFEAKAREAAKKAMGVNNEHRI